MVQLKYISAVLLLSVLGWGQITQFSVPQTGAGGLNVKIGPGRVVKSDGTTVTYAGGTVSVTASATTFVFVDTTGTVTTGSSVPSGDYPVCMVTAGVSDVQTITDLRTVVFFGSSGGGGTAAGSDQAVQVSHPTGTFFGDATNFKYDPTAHNLTVAGATTSSSFTSTSAGVWQATSLMGALTSPTGSNAAFGFGNNGFMAFVPVGVSATNQQDLIPFCNPSLDTGSETNGNYVRLHATNDCLEATGSNFATGPPFLGNGGTSAAPDFAWAGNTGCGFWLDVTHTINIIQVAAAGGCSLGFNRLISSTANAPQKTVSIGLGNGDKIAAYYSAGANNCQDGNGTATPCVTVVQSVSGVVQVGDTFGTKMPGPIRSGTSGNTDLAGILTLSGGTASYTFTNTFATAPVCVATDTTAANAVKVTTSTTTLTLTGTSTDVINYICVART